MFESFLAVVTSVGMDVLQTAAILLPLGAVFAVLTKFWHSMKTGTGRWPRCLSGCKRRCTLLARIFGCIGCIGRFTALQYGDTTRFTTHPQTWIGFQRGAFIP